LVDLGKGDLKVGAVSKVTISADDTGYTATKVSLSVEGLFDRFDGEVGISAISNFPESDLRITSKVNVLSAVGYELH
jgi:hypothetical protein